LLAGFLIFIGVIAKVRFIRKPYLKIRAYLNNKINTDFDETFILRRTHFSFCGLINGSTAASKPAEYIPNYAKKRNQLRGHLLNRSVRDRVRKE